MTHSVFSCYAAAAFGLEGLVSDELRRLGLADVHAENGGVRFSADPAGLLNANLKCRFCDRIYISLAEETCTTFEALYQLVFRIPWERYACGTEFFHLSCKCVRSKLMSPRDCQSVSKKALLERLRKQTARTRFPESGAELPILISIHQDWTRILLNTSGVSLSRRGYRTWNGEAPLRETLAAALVQLSPWRPGLPLHDPCCGTGTILVEAALMMTGRASGINRSFAMDSFSFLDPGLSSRVRSCCASPASENVLSSISGSDLDPEALKLARRHTRQAGVDQLVQLDCIPLQELRLNGAAGVFICNPPYGERMDSAAECRKLYRDLALLRQRHPGWSLCAITSDPAFERAFGKKADKKRRLYNGRLECTYYIYD